MSRKRLLHTIRKQSEKLPAPKVWPTDEWHGRKYQQAAEIEQAPNTNQESRMREVEMEAETKGRLE